MLMLTVRNYTIGRVWDGAIDYVMYAILLLLFTAQFSISL